MLGEFCLGSRLRPDGGMAQQEDPDFTAATAMIVPILSAHCELGRHALAEADLIGMLQPQIAS